MALHDGKEPACPILGKHSVDAQMPLVFVVVYSCFEFWWYWKLISNNPDNKPIENVDLLSNRLVRQSTLIDLVRMLINGKRQPTNSLIDNDVIPHY